MDNNKICIPRVLKNISYVIAPIILAILIILIVCLANPIEREAINNNKNYYETTLFAEHYTTEIISAFSTVKNLQGFDYTSSRHNVYITEEPVEGNKQVKKIYYFSERYGNNIKWLIIDKKNKEAFTNIDYSIETSTLEDVQKQIIEKGQYWNYDNENVNTTINKLKHVNYVDSRLKENSNDANNYTIYTSLQEPLVYPDDIYQAKVFYDVLLAITPKAVYLIPVLVIILVALLPVILYGVGKKKQSKEIVLNWYDRILIEVAGFIALFIGSIGACFMIVIANSYDMLTFIVGLTFAGLGSLIMYLACILFFETVVKRIKTHTFVKTLFIYWLYKNIKEL